MVDTPGFEILLGPQYLRGRKKLTGTQQCESAGLGVHILTTRVRENGLGFTLTVTNNSEHEVSEVIFPRLEMTASEPGSGFTLPVGPGWWVPFERLQEGESIRWNYPVYGSMQWVDFGGRSSGTYVGVHDRTPYVKLFEIGNRRDRAFLQVRFTDIRLRPGETFTLPEVVVCEHTDDWHAGAKIYAEWASGWMTVPAGAEWYQKSPAWSWCGMKGQHAPVPDRTYNDIGRCAQIHRQYGVTQINIAGWLENGHDTHYPDYFAGSSLGGEEALKTAVRQVHRTGSRICLYVNGRIADPGGSIGALPGWLDWTVQAPDPGSASEMQRLHANFTPDTNPGVGWNTRETSVVETYGAVDFAVMCPGSSQWRQLLIDRIERLAREYAIDGVFIDQVCGAWAYPCYSDSHDHRRPNEAWSGYMELLTELRQRVRAVNPGFQMSTEGVCDVFGQFFDVQQAHNDWDTQVGPHALPLPELYVYTFPCYTVNTGFVKKNDLYHLKLAHAVGRGLDLCDLEKDGPEDGFLRLVKRIMAWRSEYEEDLWSGVFLGALESDCPGYLAHAFQRGNTRVVTAAWVPYKSSAQAPAAVTFRLKDCDVRRARAFDESGEIPVRTGRDGADSLLTVPGFEIAIVEVEQVEAA